MTVFLLYTISPVIIDYLVSLCFSNYNNKLNENKLKIIKLVFTGIVMFLMIGLRKYTNGSGDSYVYYQHWKSLSAVELEQFSRIVANSEMEVGYTVVVFILSHIFKEPQFVFILSALFFAIAVCRFVYKNCNDVALAMIVFNSLELFIFMVQGLRQAVAMGICLFAIEQCKKRNLWKFIILIALAMSFHASAIVFCIVYFIPLLKINWRSILAVIAIFGVSTIFISYFFDFVNLFVRDEYNLTQDVVEGTGVVTVLIYLSVIVAGLLFRPGPDQDEEYHKLYSLFFYLTCTGVFIFSLRNQAASITERISFYYAFGQMALISNLVGNIKNLQTRWAFRIIIIALCFGLAVHKAGYSSLVPYLFFWQ
ncbi:MAG: EpsG family protein [Oscillospiraceae bacterium]|nr:EpsG family protein [Oscillospiraceae bacterium]